MSRLLLPILLLAAAPLAAQGDLTFRLAAIHDGPHAAADGVVDAPRLRAGDGLEPAVAAGLQRGKWRLGLSAARRSADIVLRGTESGILTTDALRALTLTVELSRRVVVGAGTLSFGVGLARTRWSFPGLADPARWRWGAAASLESELPLGGPWAMIGRVEAVRHGGVFDAEELPEGYARRTPVRLGMGTGLRWRP